MAQSSWMIYGANGYTGELVARLAVERGHRPVLAGRREDRVRPLAQELGLEWRAFSLDDASAVREAIAGQSVIAHMAGPYSATSQPMVDACLAENVHYMDITGEIPVFEAVFARHAEAVAAGIVLLTGAGFDVVPTDCLAGLLKERLPSATHLEIAILALGTLSRGTTKTMIEMMADGAVVRVDGALVHEPSGGRRRRIAFPIRTLEVVSMPWGDVSTAFWSTGIPNITCYLALPPSQQKQLRAMERFGPVVRTRLFQGVAKKLVEWTVTGPSEDVRQTKRSYIWAEVRDGERVETAMLETPEGYSFTADSAVEAAVLLAGGEVPAGAHTPATAFGSEWVLGLDGVELRE